jgi:hypothetical protein
MAAEYTWMYTDVYVRVCSSCADPKKPGLDSPQPHPQTRSMILVLPVTQSNDKKVWRGMFCSHVMQISYSAVLQTNEFGDCHHDGCLSLV